MIFRLQKTVLIYQELLKLVIDAKALERNDLVFSLINPTYNIYNAFKMNKYK